MAAICATLLPTYDHRTPLVKRLTRTDQAYLVDLSETAGEVMLKSRGVGGEGSEARGQRRGVGASAARGREVRGKGVGSKGS